MNESNNEYVVHSQDMGSVKISEEVIASIAGITTLEVEGVDSLAAGISGLLAKKSPARGIKILLENERVSVDIYIALRYGYSLPDVAKKIQANVAVAIESMTGLNVPTINVHVTSVSFAKPDKKTKS